jgi:tRNA (guanine10-N2)-dimethyltransferase
VKILLELSMECESLAKAEARSAANVLCPSPKVVADEPGIMVLESDCDPAALADRLALCHHVSEWLGSTDLPGIDSVAESLDVPGPIRVRTTRIGTLHKEADLSAITRRLGRILGSSGGVDVHSPRSDVRAVLSEHAHIGRLVKSIDRSAYESRKNRLLPFRYPISLHPKFARALVNLAEVPESGRILDPFCGTGAILVEASMIGLDSIGSDMSERMISGARKNLNHLGVNAELHVCDVGSIGSVVDEIDGIVTDPPYGRSTSTRGEPVEDLYARSFQTFSDVLRRGSRISLALPDLEVLDEVTGFRLVETHPLWVHRSLTRNFCVLTRV